MNTRRTETEGHWAIQCPTYYNKWYFIWIEFYVGVCAFKLYNIHILNIISFYIKKYKMKKEFVEKYEAYKIEHKHKKRDLIYFVSFLLFHSIRCCSVWMCESGSFCPSFRFLHWNLTVIISYRCWYIVHICVVLQPNWMCLVAHRTIMYFFVCVFCHKWPVQNACLVHGITNKKSLKMSI